MHMIIAYFRETATATVRTGLCVNLYSFVVWIEGCCVPIRLLAHYECGILRFQNVIRHDRIAKLFPHPSKMESNADQSPLVASSTVRNFLSTLCLGWYVVHWFIQLVGVFTALVAFPPRQ